MRHKLMRHKLINNPFKIASWIVISILIAVSASPRSVFAQSTADPWAVPLNLSHSGAATNPSMVVDSDGVVHVVWQDEFGNFVYAQYDGTQWSDPEQTYLHLLFGRPPSQGTPTPPQGPLYTSTNPLFIAGPGQFIFAVWVNQQGSLFASRVPNRSFKNVAMWRDAELLSLSAASFTAAVDSGGELHVTYFRTVDGDAGPAGIYYTRSRRNGQEWTDPVLVFASSYFRTLDRDKTNLGIATAGTADAPRVFIVWDNRPRKQVFLARSTDRGVSWEPALQVAGPAPNSGLDGPFNIRVGAKENTIVLIWQNGQPDVACTQFFQSSTDAGDTWGEARAMPGELPGCAQANEFVSVSPASSAGVLLLMTSFRDQVFLSAWDGVQWGEPQSQPLLSGFNDPEIYTQVEYGCHRATMSAEQLYIVGCDRSGGGDIWVTSRSLESTAGWFSSPAWSQPAPVTSDHLDVAAVDLVATGDGLIHAFFSQYQDASIYYTRWDGIAWSRFTAVIHLPDGETADWPTVAAGPRNELILVTRGSSGSLYVSRAISKEAVLLSNWSTPIRLPITHTGKLSLADIAWDATGEISIAYSVPVNDERGVYLIQSNDQGQTWSEPLQVFDGVAAGFEIVGSPSLQVSTNGQIDIMWTQQALQADGASQPLSLYFAHSEDAGRSFSKAELVVDAPVIWKKVVADSQGNLHRFWQQLDITKSLWDQVSLDGGRTWQRPQRFPRFPTEGGIATVTADAAGRLHLIDSDLGILNHWLWDGSRWEAEVPARWSVSSPEERPVERLAASVNMDGKMVVALVTPVSTGETTERHLLYLTRTLNMPPAGSVIQAPLALSPATPTVAPATTPLEGVLTPAPTVKSAPASIQSPGDNPSTSDPMPLITGVLLPVALLLLGVLGVVSLRSALGRGR